MKYLPPLRYAMPALLVIVGLVLVSLAFYEGVSDTERLIENEARAQLLTFGTRISARIEQNLLVEGSSDAHDVLLRTSNEPHLRAAAIVDTEGRVTDSTDAALLGRSLAEIAPLEENSLAHSLATQTASEHLDESGNTLSALFPFSLPPEAGQLRSHRFAALLLCNDLSEVKRLNWARHVERAWVMMAIVAVVFAVVWIYFEWAVAQRLQRLTDAMERVTRGDLSDRPIGVTGRDELGRLGEGFTKMLAEINERRKALLASEERYRSVVQAMSEGVVIQRADGVIVGSNESARRILGLSEDELHGRVSVDARWRAIREDGADFPGDQHPAMVTLRTGEPQSGVVMGVHTPAGALRWIAVNSEPCVLEAEADARGVVTTFTDVTERREAEMHAKTSRERLAAIVDSAMDGVIGTDGEMRITVFNRAAEKMFGRTEAEMLGQPLDSLLPLRYRDAHRAMMREFGSKGSSRRVMGLPGQVIGIRANGDEFPVEASIARISAGGQIMLTAMLRDVSERRRAEAQRSELESQLRQSQKLQSLGTLTGGIAHDFNNILTAISGNAKLAIADLPASHSVQRSLHEIEKAAARATELVRQVLAFGRRQEAQRSIVDIAEVMTDALRFLRAMIPATIDIRSHFSRGLSKVAIDATQLHQVITNLGSNAAHAIGDRQGAIDVTLDEVTLTEEQAHTLADLDAGRFVRLTFADNGAGIDAVILDRIFEPFFTTKELGQGTGLGLSVVHGIVKSHDGAIKVSSKRGVGTKFELYFPVSVTAENVTARESSPDHAASANANKTVIYLDDEEALVFLITRILQRRGYNVIGFTEPNRALARLTADPTSIDAFISDLAMPGMSGFDVVRRLAAIKPSLPVVLVSGYLRPQDVELAKNLGVRRVILKPDTVDALAQALDQVLTTDAVA